MTPRRRFWHVAGAGTAFQAGSTAVDSATVISALVFQLTGSSVAVGAVPTILRLGWILPQINVGYTAGIAGEVLYVDGGCLSANPFRRPALFNRDQRTKPL